MIGDATGHGVPAALITAAAHSCATTLASLGETLPDFRLSPAFILKSLDAAVGAAGRGQVQMTFFVARIDLRSGHMAYANASHELPFVCRGSRASGGRFAREHLEALATRPDPPLGAGGATVFHEYTAQLDRSDALVLYTDGLVEGRNAQGEDYGERRFARSLIQSGMLDAAALKAHLVGGALAFFGEKPPQDDVTLVVVRRLATASAVKAAG
jgi:sigma-B regulation protein RsbU (phosphoserine phosphatase)